MDASHIKQKTKSKEEHRFALNFLPSEEETLGGYKGLECYNSSCFKVNLHFKAVWKCIGLFYVTFAMVLNSKNKRIGEANPKQVFS